MNHFLAHPWAVQTVCWFNFYLTRPWRYHPPSCSTLTHALLSSCFWAVSMSLEIPWRFRISLWRPASLCPSIASLTLASRPLPSFSRTLTHPRPPSLLLCPGNFRARVRKAKREETRKEEEQEFSVTWCPRLSYSQLLLRID